MKRVKIIIAFCKSNSLWIYSNDGPAWISVFIYNETVVELIVSWLHDLMGINRLFWFFFGMSYIFPWQRRRQANRMSPVASKLGNAHKLGTAVLTIIIAHIMTHA